MSIFDQYPRSGEIDPYVFVTLRSNFFTIGFQTGSDETQVETEKLIYPLSSLVLKIIQLLSAYLNCD